MRILLITREHTSVIRMDKRVQVLYQQPNHCNQVMAGQRVL